MTFLRRIRAALHYFHSLKYPKINRTKEETTAKLREELGRRA